MAAAGSPRSTASPATIAEGADGWISLHPEVPENRRYMMPFVWSTVFLEPDGFRRHASRPRSRHGSAANW